MNKKQLLDYESPVTNVLELRFEGMVCQSLVKSSGPQFSEDASIEDGNSSIFW